MKKTTIVLATITIIAIAIAAFASLYYGKMLGNTSQPNKNELSLPHGTVPQWQIKVAGDFNQQRTFTLAEITKMPLTDVTVKAENATYRGVSLIEFCNQTGISWDAGPLSIVSAGGQSATLNIFQAWNSTYYPYSYSYNVIVLAFAKNGQWLTKQEGGPLRLIAPTFACNYQVEQVTEIQSTPWTVSIAGDVANPFVISAGNLTDFQTKTVHGNFIPGCAPNETADWTGIPISDLIQAAKAPSQVSQVCIIGIDGYEQNFTLAQVSAGEMLLGYKVNGQYYPISQGGPFRLFAPTPDYKWGQYWVKFVVEIYVS